MFTKLVNSIEYEMNINKEDFSSEKIKECINNYTYNNEFNQLLCNSNTQKKIKIFENDLFDVYIIIWNIYERSNIHNHAENGCWLKVLKGTLEENLYDSDLNYVTRKTVHNNDASFIKNNIGYHNIINIGNEKALTLHIYSPKDHKTIYY